MKKADIITRINSLITEHDLDFDAVPEDTDTKVGELKDLLSDVEDAVQSATTITVAEIARELGKDPKSVRSRLRRLYDGEGAEDLPQPVKGAGNRWTFHEDDREAITALVANED